jgi:hypothetical protein
LRIATLVISLVLAVVAGIQSATISGLGSISQNLATNSQDQQASKQISAAGGMGCLGALLWVFGAGFVIAKPKASMWIFGVSSVAWLGAGLSGFTDAFIWMAASIGFCAMSWLGTREKRAVAVPVSAPVSPDGKYWWNGKAWQAFPPVPAPTPTSKS